MPVGLSALFKKGYTSGVNDVRGPDSEDDEPVHSTRSTLPLTLVG